MYNTWVGVSKIIQHLASVLCCMNLLTHPLCCIHVRQCFNCNINCKKKTDMWCCMRGINACIQVGWQFIHCTCWAVTGGMCAAMLKSAKGKCHWLQHIVHMFMANQTDNPFTHKCCWKRCSDYCIIWYNVYCIIIVKNKILTCFGLLPLSVSTLAMIHVSIIAYKSPLLSKRG